MCYRCNRRVSLMYKAYTRAPIVVVATRRRALRGLLHVHLQLRLCISAFPTYNLALPRPKSQQQHPSPQ